MASCPKCQSSFPEHLTTCPNDGAFLEPPPHSLDPELNAGDPVGEYLVEERIGSGTFGAVYRGVHPLIAKQVAIKVLSMKYSADATVVSRFIAEARAVNQIRQKNIIDIFSFGQLADGRHYHIMELLDGTTLDQLLLERVRLPLDEMISILRPIARALDAAHASGIAHRDLKPANIFIARDDDGNIFPKLLDFGVAKLLTDELPRQHQTATGAAVGTPDYMSPEQCRGPGVDHRADVYSFGVMTYQLVTGFLPFIGTSVVDVLVKHMTVPAVPPSEACLDVPRALDAPILAMLAKEKDARPPSLAEAVGALERAIESTGVVLARSTSASDSGPLPSVSIRTAPRDASRSATLGGAVSSSDPALLATLPLEQTPSTPPEAVTLSVSRPRRVLPALVATLAVVAAAGWLLTRPAEGPPAMIAAAPESPPVPRPAPATQAAPAPPPSTEPASPPAPPEAAELEKVKITVRSSQPDVEVRGPGGVVLARTPGDLQLPRGTDKVTLEFRAPGFVAETREIVPLADGEVTVQLKKATAAKKKKKASRKKGRREAGADDIESFD